jgi:hypothetical protein
MWLEGPGANCGASILRKTEPMSIRSLIYCEQITFLLPLCITTRRFIGRINEIANSISSAVEEFIAAL